MFDIVEVGDWPPDGDEPMGTKKKFWLRAPDGIRWLFKQKTRPHSDDDSTEKLAAELAGLFGIPHAVAELARRFGHRGVISRDVLADCGAVEMIHGNSLLARTDPAYPTAERYHNAEHTVERVAAVLAERGVGQPAGTAPNPAIRDAYDLFIGYLLFDAWIGNSDRHHENWAVLRLSDGRLVMSPSYDHASCLGHNEPADRKAERLTTRDRGRQVATFAARARSALYRAERDTRPLGTAEAFVAAAEPRPDAGVYWLQRLAAVDLGRATDIVNRVPDAMMPEEARRFAVAMLEANRARLLSAPC